MWLHVKRRRRMSEKANKYYEDAFRLNVAKKIVLKRLKKKPVIPRGFWVMPGRTSAWWDNCQPDCDTRRMEELFI